MLLAVIAQSIDSDMLYTPHVMVMTPTNSSLPVAGGSVCLLLHRCSAGEAARPDTGPASDGNTDLVRTYVLYIRAFNAL